MKLRGHRENLNNNPLYLTYDVFNNTERVIRALLPHLRKVGYRGVSLGKCKPLLEQIVLMLFTSQDNCPMFHVEGTELPLCWNRPNDWNLDYIKYEWGHLRSLNQSKEAALDIFNLGLYSARCNQHIQSSMDIKELMIYGGILAQRISNVLTKRRALFLSGEWQRAISELEHLRK
jgi:hypothetical protein